MILSQRLKGLVERQIKKPNTKLIASRSWCDDDDDDDDDDVDDEMKTLITICYNNYDYIIVIIIRITSLIVL